LPDNQSIAARYKKRNYPRTIYHPVTHKPVNPQYVRFLADEYDHLYPSMQKRMSALANTVSIEIQGELLKIKYHHPTLAPQLGSGRGRITSFTNKARKNMLETVSRIDWTGQRAQFITLTYHENMQDAQTAKKHKRALLKRWYRRFGLLATLWKLEPQKRGAWHFHLLVWGMPYLSHNDLLADWRGVTGDDTITQVKIEPIQSAKKARSYVAKYVGKPVLDSLLLQLFALALWWHPAHVLLVGLDYLPKQAVWFFPGRFWGIENRKKMHWATLRVVSVARTPAIWQLKRGARRQWRGINANQYQGFTLFVRNPSQWLDYLFYLIGMEYQNER